MAFWRELCGPTDPDAGGIQHLRALFGTDMRENALYGAKSHEDVQMMVRVLRGGVVVAVSHNAAS